MILQSGSTIKVIIELPVATRHRRDTAEKLLKATLNSNTQKQQQLFGIGNGALFPHFGPTLSRKGTLINGKRCRIRLLHVCQREFVREAQNLIFTNFGELKLRFSCINYEIIYLVILPYCKTLKSAQCLIQVRVECAFFFFPSNSFGGWLDMT